MDQKRYVEGLIMGGIAFVLWGLLPLYWKWVSAITPYEIFAQRVIWSFLFVLILLKWKKALGTFVTIIKKPENIIKTILPAFFISLNWMLYIWSVNNGYVIEASLGYYINPLVLTLLGAIAFKERLTKGQAIGITLATIGVLYKTLTYGKVPFIALTLAIAFGVYGLLKKKSNLSSLDGLGIETFIIGVPALIYLLFTEGSGSGITGNLPGYYWIMISFSGFITAVPLLLYAEGTKRLPLNIVGFLQYIAPTISLFLGVVVFNETFDLNGLYAFGFIWLGLIVFSREQYLLLKQRQKVEVKA